MYYFHKISPERKKTEELKNHITWKLYILPRSVGYLREICPEVTEILDNKVTHQKNRNLLTRTI